MSSATEFLEKILDLVHEDYPEVVEVNTYGLLSGMTKTGIYI